MNKRLSYSNIETVFVLSEGKYFVFRFPLFVCLLKPNWTVERFQDWTNILWNAKKRFSLFPSSSSANFSRPRPFRTWAVISSDSNRPDVESVSFTWGKQRNFQKYAKKYLLKKKTSILSSCPLLSIQRRQFWYSHSHKGGVFTFFSLLLFSILKGSFPSQQRWFYKERLFLSFCNSK